MEKQALYIDPRTKLFLLLVMNIVMLDTSSGVLLPYLRFIIGFLPFVLLLTSKRFKPAWVYLVIYLISHIIVLYVLDYTSGFMMMLLGFLSSMGTKFLPGGMLGSQKVIIPVSVMFRFFTTVKEEAEGISDAMRMRKLGFSYFFFKPVEILEYRLVPLMISVVNIGEDLSASALTRCLGYKKSRTNISRCGFGWVDYALFVLGIGFILLYFLELGGVI